MDRGEIIIYQTADGETLSRIHISFSERVSAMIPARVCSSSTSSSLILSPIVRKYQGEGRTAPLGALHCDRAAVFGGDQPDVIQPEAEALDLSLIHIFLQPQSAKLSPICLIFVKRGLQRSKGRSPSFSVRLKTN